MVEGVPRRTDRRAEDIQRALARWFSVRQRDLPWRHTRDPYRILVSEVMLQQTQVERVLPKYRAFLERFPTVRALARASPRDVLLAWAGMGYNRRALYLLRTAREIVRRFGGSVPTNPAVLATLPGVGAYTAAAVATFATGIPRPLADTNVRRVIGRIFGGHPLPQRLRRERTLLALVERTMPWRRVAGMHPALWGHALMDFGALVCRARPRCEVCPLTRWCRAYPAFQGKGGVQRPARAHRRYPGARAVPDRLARGAILRLVRERDPAPLLLADLQVHLLGCTPARLRRLVRALRADGLLTGDESVSLPRTLDARRGS